MTKVLAAAVAAGLGFTLALVPPAMAAGRQTTTSQVRPQVAGLQVALRAWGLYDGPIDAIDGPGTRAAVRAFQQRVKNVAGFAYVADPLPMKNRNNAVVYYLCFASQKPVAQKIIEGIFAQYR